MKQHTIIFVPHARAKFRKWRLSTLQVGLILGTLVFLTVGGIIAIISSFNITIDREQLQSIQAENADLREVNQGFETSIRSLENQVEDYQQRIHKLAIVAGLSELSPSAEGGIGGDEPISSERNLNQNLSSLESQLQAMESGMDLLQEKLEADRLLISATPAIAPVKGIFTSSFGHRTDPFTHQKAFHPGIDIVAPRGKEIQATGDGIIIKAERAQGLGKCVYISHGFGIVTRYGHMSKILVKPGQNVRRGDVIGLVGSTGRSTGNHVHYEVHVNGKPTNPLGYILDGIGP